MGNHGIKVARRDPVSERVRDGNGEEGGFFCYQDVDLSMRTTSLADGVLAAQFRSHETYDNPHSGLHLHS